jgi:putative transposase
MPRTFSLTATQRGALLDIYRKDPDPELRSRAHILLLLGEGHPRDAIEAMPSRSSRTVDRWPKRSRAEGVSGLAGRERGRPFRPGLGGVALLVTWVTTEAPGDFGFLRSRWSCALPAPSLRDREGVDAGRETVRRLLHRGHPVYRRPRPALKPDEEERQAGLAESRGLLEGLPDDEAAVWQDEVGVHTSPKVGRMWMSKGRQAEVATPGTNRGRHLSGSIHRGAGQVFVTEAAPKRGRDGAPLIKHLDERRRRPRRCRKTHVICDNASRHTSLEVIPYLWKWGGRIEVHLLPPYSPGLNPIERIRWHRHEDITRDHRRKDLGGLLEKVFAWLGQENPFEIEGSVYPKARAA